MLIFAVLMGALGAIPVCAQLVVAHPDTYDFYIFSIGEAATMTGSLENANEGTINIVDYISAVVPKNCTMC